VVLAACASPDDALNRAPVAAAGKDLRAVLQTSPVYVALDGAASFDPDGDDLTYRWDVVRAPSPLVLSRDQRKADKPVVGLPGPGLYIFSLVVSDDRDESTPDFVDVWVQDPAWSADGGADDAGTLLRDAMVDAAPPDAAIPDAAVPDAAPLWDAVPVPDAAPFPDAAHDNARPLAVIDVEPFDRVAVDTPVRLSAARSRDDGGPRPLTYRWEQTGAPFGEAADFHGEGVGVQFTPHVAGRYTLRLRVDDGALSSDAEVVIHAVGPVGYLIDPTVGRAQRIGLDGGAPLGDPIPLGDLRGAVGVLVRAGIIDVTTRASGNAPAHLVTAVPGRPVVRRALPADGDPAPPASGAGAVWVPMQAAPAVIGSDPTGTEPLVTLPLPDRYASAWGLDAGGASLFLGASRNPGLLLLDPVGRRFARALFERSDRCTPRDVLVRGAQIYVGCGEQNALARVPTDFAGDLGPEDVVGLPAREVKVVRAGDRLVVMHARSTFVTVVPLARFDLPPDAPDRAPGRQTVVSLTHEVVDVAAQGRNAYALVHRADGGYSMVAVDAPAARVVWAVRLDAATPAFLATDVADDLERPLDRL
jgi:hypothetical protein